MRTFNALGLILAVLLGVCSWPGLATAHQSISYPYAVSRERACSVSGTKKCARPCPRNKLRLDVNPDNPSTSTTRGGSIMVNTFANNHGGGFSRWSFVHVRDMHNEAKHQENAFLFTCTDLRVANCSRRYKERDCISDRRNEYYRHRVKIPLILPDGVYVLGWVWYGGGKRWGSFTDYYDCLYVKIEGGPKAKRHRPEFRTGPSLTAQNGKCRASNNRVGTCWRNPCPGGEKRSTLQKPFEFINKVPKAIRADIYTKPYRQKPRGSVYVESITIRSTRNPDRIFTTSKRSSTPYIRLTDRNRATITAETSGNVRSVTFYTDGYEGRTDTTKPYAAVPNWPHKDKKGFRYNNYNFRDRRVMTISAKAVGWDGSFHWRTMELSIDR